MKEKRSFCRNWRNEAKRAVARKLFRFQPWAKGANVDAQMLCEKEMLKKERKSKKKKKKKKKKKERECWSTYGSYGGIV